MQILFESVHKNGENPNIVNFIPNSNILPTYIEIDAMIKKLENLKKEMTDVEIKLHNKKQWERLEQDNFQREINTKKAKNDKEGYIYLIKNQEYYKIGRSQTPKARIKKYRTENPNLIEVILCKKVDNYKTVENALLSMFHEKNHRGEWFELNNDDIKMINKFLNG